jgi:hypothetical protein
MNRIFVPLMNRPMWVKVRNGVITQFRAGTEISRTGTVLVATLVPLDSFPTTMQS